MDVTHRWNSWELAIRFLDWMHFEAGPQDRKGMCLLCCEGDGVMTRCCGAPICHECMFRWWDDGRHHGTASMQCPWCCEDPAIAWFHCENNGQEFHHADIPSARWVVRRDLLTLHYTHRNMDPIDALVAQRSGARNEGDVTRFCVFMEWQRDSETRRAHQRRLRMATGFAPRRRASGSDSDSASDAAQNEN